MAIIFGTAKDLRRFYKDYDDKCIKEEKEAEKIKSEKVEKSDHIKVCRGDYWHHGIAISSKKIIHFAGKKCIDQTPEIVMTSLSNFLEGGSVEFVFYKKCYDAKKTVEIANRLLKENQKYSLIFSNCEHLATFCKIGSWRSEQVSNNFKFLVRCFEYLLKGY
jgi:single-stranded DNA-specific DHH superfamily exonuclease